MRALELGTVGEMRERLNGLVLAGLRKATAGPLPKYEDEPFERSGERLVDDDETSKVLPLPKPKKPRGH
jgi:hypothetical protein